MPTKRLTTKTPTPAPADKKKPAAAAAPAQAQAEPLQKPVKRAAGDPFMRGRQKQASWIPKRPDWLKRGSR